MEIEDDPLPSTVPPTVPAVPGHVGAMTRVASLTKVAQIPKVMPVNGNVERIASPKVSMNLGRDSKIAVYIPLGIAYQLNSAMYKSCNSLKCL